MNDGATQHSVWGNFKQWAAKPFSVDMTATEWFLFIGLLLVIMVLWNIILYRIVELVRE